MRVFVSFVSLGVLLVQATVNTLISRPYLMLNIFQGPQYPVSFVLGVSICLDCEATIMHECCVVWKTMHI